MATFTELVILREEEHVLMKIASKLNDQLNRLKVEELALMSMIRKNKSGAQHMSSRLKPPIEQHIKQEDSEAVEQTVNNHQELDLDVFSSLHNVREMEEEEEDEEEEEEGEVEEAMKHDQLTAFLDQMELQYRK